LPPAPSRAPRAEPAKFFFCKDRCYYVLGAQNQELDANPAKSVRAPAAWEAIGEIESAHSAGDWAGVGDAGHKLKGAARTIGANQLADICEALEKAGKAGRDKNINKLMPKLRPSMEAVEVYVRGRADASP